MRVRELSQIESERKSRVILLVHRQETMSIFSRQSAVTSIRIEKNDRAAFASAQVAGKRPGRASDVRSRQCISQIEEPHALTRPNFCLGRVARGYWRHVLKNHDTC
jgi:hypothetical protein